MKRYLKLFAVILDGLLLSVVLYFYLGFFGNPVSKLLMKNSAEKYVAENYPDLKANQQFLELQAQLEGTENRIEVAREDYNKASKSFNSSVRKFPTNLFASIFGFEMYDYYEAEEGAEIAPEVQF